MKRPRARPALGSAAGVLVLALSAASPATACCTPLDDATPEAFKTCGGNRYAGLPFATRSPIYAQHGAAATSVALASQVRMRRVRTRRHLALTGTCRVASSLPVRVGAR